MTNLLWIATMLGGVAGLFLLLAAFSMNSAPQQGAIAAVGIGLGVLPYCIARAWSEMRGKNREVNIRES